MTIEGMNHFTVYPGDAYFTMNGKEVKAKATTAVPECIREVLRINGRILVVAGDADPGATHHDHGPPGPVVHIG